VLLIIAPKNSYAMLETKNGDSHRESFTPLQKKAPKPIKYRSNPSKEELKIDKDRQMPYYGNSLSAFSYGHYDTKGGKTLRATARVTDSDLYEELKRQDLNQIYGINLIDQGLITDSALLFLSENIPDLAFLNVQNTHVTEEGLRKAKFKFRNIKIKSSFKEYNDM
jgi:hypothetical protein